MLPALPGNAEDRDQLVVTEPQREVVVTREPGGMMVHVVEPVAAATVAGGGLRAFAETAPLLTPVTGCGTGGPWTLAPAPWRLSVPAALNDVIEWTPAVALGGTGTAALDVAVLLGGAVVRYLSSGTTVPAELGHGGLYVSGAYGAARLSTLRHRVQLGELSGDTIPLALAYRADPDGAMTLGHAQIPSIISMINLGPTSGLPNEP